MKKTHYYFSMLVIVLAFVLIAVVGFWLLYPYKTVEYKIPIQVREKVLMAGDTLHYEIEYCKYVDSPTYITLRFVNSIVISLPERVANAQKGCGTIQTVVEIPQILEPDTYILEMTATNKVNPLREITVHYFTEEFEIVK